MALLLFVPFAVWQISHGLPMLEFIRNATSRKMVAIGPLAFLGKQLIGMNPLALPIVFAGLIGSPAPEAYYPLRVANA